ncbi:MAG: helix-turn-helix domain-containing protein [Vicinamibacterales bacterium]
MKVPKYDELPELCTPIEAAAFLRVSRNGIYELIRTGAVPSLKFGRLIRVPKSVFLPGVKARSETRS